MLGGLHLIAEIGVNHNGDPELAADMIHRCARSGFGSVKFQYWNPDETFAAEVPTAGYQGEGDQRELVAPLRLRIEQLAELRSVAHALGLRFIVTGDDELACKELIDLGLDALKIGSGDCDNPWVLEQATASGLPVILSTGMCSPEELEDIRNRLFKVVDLTVLHCVSAYPTAVADAGLWRIVELRDRWNRPVGFSDHTLGVAAAAAAVAIGATTIEKHVTPDPSMDGPDHAMSLSLADADAFVAELRGVYSALTAPVPAEAELQNRRVVRKSLYLRRLVTAGEVLNREDLVPLRPLLDGIPALDRDRVIGRRVVTELGEGDRLRWSDVGEE